MTAVSVLPGTLGSFSAAIGWALTVLVEVRAGSAARGGTGEGRRGRKRSDGAAPDQAASAVLLVG
jgi:hypothetical protein